MRTLIVGAGALGRVFGYHLAAGGSDVSALVRPRGVEAARKGFALEKLRKSRKPVPGTFTPQAVFTGIDALTDDWDVIWLCVHSPSLREPLLASLRNRAGSATIVSIGMGIDDRDALERVWPGEQVVEIFPSILSFVRPPIGENDSATAFWIPPGFRDLSGSEARARPIADLLSAGGMPARYVGSTPSAPFASAVNVPMAVAAELGGWTTKANAPAQVRRLALEAAREAVVIAARHLGVATPKLPSPFSVWLGDRLFALAAPFDTRVFTQQNYTKVADQTLDMIQGSIDSGLKYSLETRNLAALRNALVAHRSATNPPESYAG